MEQTTRTHNLSKRLLSILLAAVMCLSVMPMLHFRIEAAADAEYEYALYPMDYLNISQGSNGGYSHAGTKALDMTGKDGGSDPIYAPFTGTIKKTYGVMNCVWFQSNAPVIFADGTIDYMTIMFLHDEDISNIENGKVFV